MSISYVRCLTLSVCLCTLASGLIAAEPLGSRPTIAVPNAEISRSAGIDWMRPYDRPAATAIKRKATGFFRVEQIEGKWWFIDPKGFALWGAGMNGGGSEQVHTPDLWGNLPDKLYAAKKATVEKVHGPGMTAWVDFCRRTLDEGGFQIMSQHSGDQSVGPLPSTRLIDFGDFFFRWEYSKITDGMLINSGEWHDIPNVWHPE